VERDQKEVVSGGEVLKLEEFGGLSAADCWVQQVAVYFIFKLKTAQMR